MAIAFVGTRGGNTGKSSSTTIQMAIGSATIPAGAGVVVRIECDSIDATVGDTTHVTLADSKGNTWVRSFEYQMGGSAGAGIIVAVFVSTLTTALVITSDNITATFDTAVVARTINAIELSVAAGKTFTVGTASTTHGTSTTPSVTISGLSNIERLWVGILGIEGTSPDFSTEDADFTLAQSNGVTGAPATDNIYGRTSYRLATQTGDTFNPTLANSRDWVIGLIPISETSSGLSAAVGQPSETDSAQAILARKTSGAGQSSETDAALGLTHRKTVAMGLATTTEIALSLVHVKTRQLGLAVETDVAQSVSHVGHLIGVLGIVVETDTPLAITHKKARVLGLVSESDSARPITHRKTRTVGQAVETDSAQSAIARKKAAIGQALELDVALAIVIPRLHRSEYGSAAADREASSLATSREAASATF